MKWQESFKHWVGIHGPDAEWLVGRIFADGSYLRTYYCPVCKTVFHKGNAWHLFPRQTRMSYEQLKQERDEGKNAMQQLLLKKPYKESPTISRPFSEKELQKEMEQIRLWLHRGQ